MPRPEGSAEDTSCKIAAELSAIHEAGPRPCLELQLNGESNLAHWQFRPSDPNDNSGESTVDDNFAVEERTSVEILVRETLQNPLDARAGDLTVRVRYSIVEIDRRSSRFAQALFSDDCLQHFVASGLMKQDKLPEKVRFLLVEDFGTTGLEGTYTDSYEDGSTQNWNAFWFREGEGAKQARSNGGAGQGKITLYLTSGLRTVVALTHRKSDQRELLFGCCRFKHNYKLAQGGAKWAKEARWGATRKPNELALPITDEKLISDVKLELGLEREGAAGTSFIVPMPIADVTEDALLQAVVNEFFFAIRRGRLEVTVGNTRLDSQSITSAADELGDRCRLSKEYRQFLELAIGAPANAHATAKEHWSKATKLADAAFDPAELAQLKSTFELGELVAIDLPIPVKPKEGAAGISKFRVFLQQHSNIEQSQELFVRQDLAIDGEKRLKGSRSIEPVLALTFVVDAKLSELLVAAEEPTHRNWNARRTRVIRLFVAPDKVLNAVRNAALRLVQLLSPEGKRDDTALSIYFADPASPPGTRKGNVGDQRNPINPDAPQVKNIPPPVPKPVSLSVLKNGFTVRAVKLQDVVFPVQCEVEMAYAITSGDSYSEWDAADFWVNDDSSFPIKVSGGVSEVVRDGNVVSFLLESDASELTLTGFDARRQLDLRLKYREVVNAPDHQDN